MAFSNAPTSDTYSSKRIGFTSNISFRASTPVSETSLGRDSGVVNVLPFKYDNEIVGETRASLISTATWPSGVVRGLHVWEKTPGVVYFFCVVGTTVYSSTDGITFSDVGTFSTNADTPVRFTEFINDVNTKRLILVDGVEGMIYSDNATGGLITDPNFPTPHVPFPIFLDGYLFLAKASTGDIYNSNLNDPSLWSAGDYISTEMYPDDLQALVKINNYICAIGSQSCEFFYDAANATASPLARVDGSVLPLGTVLPNSIAYNKNTLTMIANRNDGASVLVLIEDLKYKEIEAGIFTGLLNHDILSSKTSKDYIRGFYFRQNGELFYGLRFADGSSLSLSKQTFVYSFTHNIWVQFSYAEDGSEAYPAIFTSTSTSNDLRSYVAGNVPGAYAWFGKMSEGFSASGFDSINASDDEIYQELRTSNNDFGTMNMKQMNRLSVNIEFMSTPAVPSGAQIDVTWSDDDFNTSATARVIDLNLANTGSVPYGYYPAITQLGMFRRRAFKFTSSVGDRIRWKFFEVDINKGQQ